MKHFIHYGSFDGFIKPTNIDFKWYNFVPNDDADAQKKISTALVQKDFGTAAITLEKYLKAKDASNEISFSNTTGNAVAGLLHKPILGSDPNKDYDITLVILATNGYIDL